MRVQYNIEIQQPLDYYSNVACLIATNISAGTFRMVTLVCDKDAIANVLHFLQGLMVIDDEGVEFLNSQHKAATYLCNSKEGAKFPTVELVIINTSNN